MLKSLKVVWDRITGFVKSLGAFSLGALIGVCYGSAVGTIVSYTLLKSME